MRHLIQFVVYLIAVPFILLYLFLFKPRFTIVAIINGFTKKIRVREWFDEMPLADIPYVFHVVNTTDTIKNVVLFGYNRYVMSRNFGSDEGVKINCNNPSTSFLYGRSHTSHLEIISQANHNPFTIGTIRIQGGPSRNADFHQYDLMGNKTISNIRMYCIQDDHEGNFNEKKADYLCVANGINHFEFTINPKEDLEIMCYPVIKQLDNRFKTEEQIPVCILWIKELFKPRKITDI